MRLDLAAARDESAGEMTLEECVARAMDGADPAIVPYLPYLLQDSWEIGTSPEAVEEIVRARFGIHGGASVLDLGCGKGAVSVRLAAGLGSRCLGIDALEEFIDFAEGKAREAGVGHLCRFETGDIRKRVSRLGRFDVIVLGAIGPVFGDYRTTLEILAPHLSERGIVVVDDGYFPDDSPHTHPLIFKRSDMLRQIAEAGMRLARERAFDREWIARMDEEIFRGLEKRCRELMGRHPEKKPLFEDYLRRQVEENDVLENKVVCALLVIEKSGRADEPV